MYLPSRSVIVPLVVPFSTTLAPIIAFPSASLTTPVIRFLVCWATMFLLNTLIFRPSIEYFKLVLRSACDKIFSMDLSVAFTLTFTFFTSEST